jgi:hypothetical protein
VVLAPETQLWLCGLDSFVSGVLPQALVLAGDASAAVVGYPPTWLDPLQITRTSTEPVLPGSTFVSV